MIHLRVLWRRLFPPSDGSICGRPGPGCDLHEALGAPCRCLNLPGHDDMHECGQGARWDDDVRSRA